MKIYNLLFYYSFLLLFMACNSPHNTKTNYTLHPTSEYKTFPLDENIYMPRQHVQLVEISDTITYLAFQNHLRPEIIIYDLKTNQLIQKIKYDLEGDQGITGGFKNFYIKDLNTIYLLGNMKHRIYLTDSSKNIKEIIDFSFTKDGHTLDIPSLELGQLEFINNKIYLPQYLNGHYGHETLEKSPLGIIIDLSDQSIEELPMKFPSIITFDDFYSGRAIGAAYCRCFNGSEFVYSFWYNDKVYKTAPDHKEVEEYIIQSQYIKDIKFTISKNADFKKGLKETCEIPQYRNILYDKYRKVYYLFAHPQIELDENENFLDLIHFGKKLFTIIILNEDMEIMGETLFPEYTYAPYVHFITEDGLYLSRSHFKNPAYDDNLLCFERIDLIESGSH